MEDLEKLFETERKKCKDEDRIAKELSDKYYTLRRKQMWDLFCKLKFLEKYGFKVKYSCINIRLSKAECPDTEITIVWENKKIGKETYFWCNENAYWVDWRANCCHSENRKNLFTSEEELIKAIAAKMR